MSFLDIFKKKPSTKSNVEVYSVKENLSTNDTINENKNESELDPGIEADRIKILGFNSKEGYDELLSVAREESDIWIAENQDRLTAEAMKRSAQFQDIHEKAISQIDINALKQVVPTSPQKLQPIEILFLRYINNVCTFKPNIAGYWTHEYNIAYQLLLEKLFSYSYLTLSDLKFNISKCTSDELKRILSNHSLKTVGKKADLIDRVYSEISKNELETIFKNPFFLLTASGKDLVDANEHIYYFHSYHNYLQISIDEADKVKKENPSYTNFDIGNNILRQRLNVCVAKSNWGLYSNTLFGISILNNHINDATEELLRILQCCYIYICGYRNNGLMNPPKSESFPPLFISSIKRICNNGNISYSDLNYIYNAAIKMLPIYSEDQVQISYTVLLKELGKSTVTIKQNETYVNNTPNISKVEDTPITTAVSKSIEIASNSEYHNSWYISVSFSKSSSANFDRALFLAKQANRYIETDFNGKTIYQSIYTSEPQSYLNFIMLYEVVGNWKSSFVIINDNLIDRKIVGGLNYCYGDRCRNGRSMFCFGASVHTENPFGCHRLQISADNNPWWQFSHFNGVNYIIDKQAIRKRIDEYSTAFKCCPNFNYEKIIEVFNQIPQSISVDQFNNLETNKFFLGQTNKMLQ